MGPTSKKAPSRALFLFWVRSISDIQVPVAGGGGCVRADLGNHFLERWRPEAFIALDRSTLPMSRRFAMRGSLRFLFWEGCRAHLARIADFTFELLVSRTRYRYASGFSKYPNP